MNEVTHDEYVEYFTNLFSYSDRPSSPNHLLIEKKVLEYFEGINNKSLKIEFNKLHIQDSLKNLKTNKASGFDGLSNEFFKVGNCDILVEIFKLLFDGMASMGYIPNNLDKSNFGSMDQLAQSAQFYFLNRNFNQKSKSV